MFPICLLFPICLSPWNGQGSTVAFWLAGLVLGMPDWAIMADDPIQGEKSSAKRDAMRINLSNSFKFSIVLLHEDVNGYEIGEVGRDTVSE